jgi:rubrerythrin
MTKENDIIDWEYERQMEYAEDAREVIYICKVCGNHAEDPESCLGHDKCVKTFFLKYRNLTDEERKAGETLDTSDSEAVCNFCDDYPFVIEDLYRKEDMPPYSANRWDC